VLTGETADSVVEPFLRLALVAAERWSPDDVRDDLLSTIADTCLALTDNESRRTVALRGLASSAVTDDQRRRLRDAAADDVDLHWRALIRFAELGTYDQDEVDALERSDPNPDAWTRTLAVSAARPDHGAKDEVWQKIVDKHEVPMEAIGEVSTAFWRPSQPDLLRPFADRYLDAIPTMHDEGMMAALAVSISMFPRVGVDGAFVDTMVAAAKEDGVSPLVSRTVLEATDQLRRQLAARGQA
jgi:aminopeptidase N